MPLFWSVNARRRQSKGGRRAGACGIVTKSARDRFINIDEATEFLMSD
jgi:hypothetical protein